LREDIEHSSSLLGCIIDHGGEGAIMRKCGSLYVPGRSLALIKLKDVPSDAEGLVVDVTRNGVLLKLYVSVIIFCFWKKNLFSIFERVFLYNQLVVFDCRWDEATLWCHFSGGVQN